MNRTHLIFLTALILLLPGQGVAESSRHHHHDHHGDGFEFGVSLEYAYLKEDHGEDEEEGEEEHEHEVHGEHDESESVPGLHLHLIKGISSDGIGKHFGVGLSGEVLFTDDPHYSVMGSLAIYPWSEWNLLLSPGVEFASHEGSYEREFSMHYELGYSWQVGEYHIGPVIGFAHTKDSEHYSAGIHLGF
jgi:hypothetical protein